MTDIRQKILLHVASFYKELSLEGAMEFFDYPPDKTMGDISFACFKLSKTLRKSPVAIAGELRDYFESTPIDVVAKTEAVGGYLNIYLSDGYFCSFVSEIIEKGEDYGKNEIGKGKNIVLDYSSPNIAKPFHIGHLGTTAIGNAIKNIYSFCGYNCIGINHLGDWGTQFGRLIVAYKLWGDKKRIEERGVKELADIYKDFYIKAEENDELNDMARAEFAKLEQGDAEALALWEWFKDISLKEFMKIYDLLGIKFESYNGESFYNDKMEAVVKELSDKGLLEEDDGAMIVKLDEYNMPPCLILKKDKSTLYATRDITAALYRNKTYNFDKCIYVTDAGQSLHFAQWFKVIELMGYDWSKGLVHVPYGKISVDGKKLATRTGNVVLLEELFEDAISRVKKIIEEKNPDRENKDEIARKVGLGAVIFNQLYSGRIKDVNFVWEDVLNFDGNTGPYVQYTYARSCSVLEKEEKTEPFGTVALTAEEKELVLLLESFGEKVISAMNNYEPSTITRYCLQLAQAFNRFYHNCPVLKAEDSVKAFRFALCKAFKITLGNALSLIGIEKTEKL